MAIALSFMVLTAIALLFGAYALFRRGRRGQAALMLVLAVIIGLNVAIWTVPTQSGDTLVSASLVDPSVK